MNATQSKMKPPRSRLATAPVLLALSLAAGGLALAQDFAPHIGYVYPAGGGQGTTVEVTVGGQYLVAPNAAIVSGDGVRAVVIPAEPLLSGKQAAEARGKLKELRKQRSPATREEIRKLNRKLALHEKSKITPAIGEQVAVKISIAPDAPPGNRELRLVTATGLTNALVFQVGALSECREPDSGKDENWVRIQKTVNDPDSRVKAGRNDAPPMAVTLPTTINGRILPGEADRFCLKARRGQTLVVDVSARELLPYLADTVPGWMQSAVSMFDSSGKELRAAGDVQIHADPVLRYEIPADGEYVLEIRDNLYRGRDDFVYRIRVGEPALLAKPAPTDNALAAQTPEKEPNNTPDDAQPVAPPVVIKGRIDEPGDIDVFRFEGKAGARVVAEVYARRLDSPLDSLLIISDAAGNRIGFNDDHEDKGSGLNTHHADSYLAVTLPADGVYYAHIGDTQQNGGGEYGYLLRISPPQPDFALRVVPSTLNMRANATQPVTVYALRRDGFDGEITLTLKDASTGFSPGGGVIPAHQDKVQCTLTAPASRGNTLFKLALEGRAKIDGRKIVRAAVPAQEMTQAFFYQHLVPGADWFVFVGEKHAPAAPAKFLGRGPLKIPARGGVVKARFRVPRYLPSDTGQVRLLNPPEGIALKNFSLGNGDIVLEIEADAEKIKPGAGNLIAEFVAKDTTPPGAPRKNPRRVPLGCLPAIAFEVVGGEVSTGSTGTTGADR
ncbi:hypothetical protein M2447_000761 [Ereboglobus sp. PH5-10]|nr:hypothetical protein [Ereboglobus sp. PH5-10]